MGKIGIMGGTFDPIHIGHLIAADNAREQCSLDEVWFIPTYRPPLKDNAPGVSSERRMQMVELAVAGNPAFRAVDIELKRGGVSYSYDTVQELQRLYPQHSFSYIIGSDRINDLAKWHRIEQLAALVTFIGLERPDEPIQLESLPSYLRQRVHLCAMPAIGISSTAIRSRRSSGQSVQYMVPEPVFQFIGRHALYESRGNN